MKRIRVLIPLELRCMEAEPLELLVEDWEPEHDDVEPQVSARIGERWMPVGVLGGDVVVER